MRNGPARHGDGVSIAITGGREHQPTATEMDEFWQVWADFGGTVLVHGDCRGCDRTVAGWARMRGIHVVPYGVKAVDGPWPGAGPRRNRRMLDTAKPELLIAFPGNSGTADCVKAARLMKISVYLIG